MSIPVNQPKPQIHGNLVDKFRAVATEAYQHGSSSEEGWGRMGLLNKRVVKFNTHLGERNAKVKAEDLKAMKSSCQQLRDELVQMIRTAYGEGLGRATGVQKAMKALGLDTEKKVQSDDLIKRSLVARLINVVKKDLGEKDAKRVFGGVVGSASLKDSTWGTIEGQPERGQILIKDEQSSDGTSSSQISDSSFGESSVRISQQKHQEKSDEIKGNSSQRHESDEIIDENFLKDIDENVLKDNGEDEGIDDQEQDGIGDRNQDDLAEQEQDDIGEHRQENGNKPNLCETGKVESNELMEESGKLNPDDVHLEELPEEEEKELLRQEGYGDQPQVDHDENELMEEGGKLNRQSDNRLDDVNIEECTEEEEKEWLRNQGKGDQPQVDQAPQGIAEQPVQAEEPVQRQVGVRIPDTIKADFVTFLGGAQGEVDENSELSYSSVIEPILEFFRPYDSTEGVPEDLNVEAMKEILADEIRQETQLGLYLKKCQDACNGNGTGAVGDDSIKGILDSISSDVLIYSVQKDSKLELMFQQAVYRTITGKDIEPNFEIEEPQIIQQPAEEPVEEDQLSESEGDYENVEGDDVVHENSVRAESIRESGSESKIDVPSLTVDEMKALEAARFELNKESEPPKFDKEWLDLQNDHDSIESLPTGGEKDLRRAAWKEEQIRLMKNSMANKADLLSFEKCLIGRNGNLETALAEFSLRRFMDQPDGVTAIKQLFPAFPLTEEDVARLNAAFSRLKNATWTRDLSLWNAFNNVQSNLSLARGEPTEVVWRHYANAVVEYLLTADEASKLEEYEKDCRVERENFCTRQQDGVNTCALNSMLNAMLIAGGKLAEQAKNIMLERNDGQRTYFVFPFSSEGQPETRIYMDDVEKFDLVNQTNREIWAKMSPFEKAAVFALKTYEFDRKYVVGSPLELEGVAKLFGFGEGVVKQITQSRCTEVEGEVDALKIVRELKADKMCILYSANHFMALTGVVFDERHLPRFAVMDSLRGGMTIGLQALMDFGQGYYLYVVDVAPQPEETVEEQQIIQQPAEETDEVEENLVQDEVEDIREDENFSGQEAWYRWLNNSISSVKIHLPGKGLFSDDGFYAFELFKSAIDQLVAIDRNRPENENLLYDTNDVILAVLDRAAQNVDTGFGGLLRGIQVRCGTAPDEWRRGILNQLQDYAKTCDRMEDPVRGAFARVLSGWLQVEFAKAVTWEPQIMQPQPEETVEEQQIEETVEERPPEVEAEEKPQVASQVEEVQQNDPIEQGPAQVEKSAVERLADDLRTSVEFPPAPNLDRIDGNDFYAHILENVVEKLVQTRDGWPTSDIEQDEKVLANYFENPPEGLKSVLHAVHERKKEDWVFFFLERLSDEILEREEAEATLEALVMKKVYAHVKGSEWRNPADEKVEPVSNWIGYQELEALERMKGANGDDWLYRDVFSVNYESFLDGQTSAKEFADELEQAARALTKGMREKLGNNDLKFGIGGEVGDFIEHMFGKDPARGPDNGGLHWLFATLRNDSVSARKFKDSGLLEMLWTRVKDLGSAGLESESNLLSAIGVALEADADEGLRKKQVRLEPADAKRPPVDPNVQQAEKPKEQPDAVNVEPLKPQEQKAETAPEVRHLDPETFDVDFVRYSEGRAGAEDVAEKVKDLAVEMSLRQREDQGEEARPLTLEEARTLVAGSFKADAVPGAADGTFSRLCHALQHDVSFALYSRTKNLEGELRKQVAALRDAEGESAANLLEAMTELLAKSSMANYERAENPRPLIDAELTQLEQKTEFGRWAFADVFRVGYGQFLGGQKNAVSFVREELSLSAEKMHLRMQQELHDPSAEFTLQQAKDLVGAMLAGDLGDDANPRAFSSFCDELRKGMSAEGCLRVLEGRGLLTEIAFEVDRLRADGKVSAANLLSAMADRLTDIAKEKTAEMEKAKATEAENAKAAEAEKAEAKAATERYLAGVATFVGGLMENHRANLKKDLDWKLDNELFWKDVEDVFSSKLRDALAVRLSRCATKRDLLRMVDNAWCESIRACALKRGNTLANMNLGYELVKDLGFLAEEDLDANDFVRNLGIAEETLAVWTKNAEREQEFKTAFWPVYRETLQNAGFGEKTLKAFDERMEWLDLGSKVADGATDQELADEVVARLQQSRPEEAGDDTLALPVCDEHGRQNPLAAAERELANAKDEASIAAAREKVEKVRNDLFAETCDPAFLESVNARVVVVKGDDKKQAGLTDTAVWRQAFAYVSLKRWLEDVKNPDFRMSFLAANKDGTGFEEKDLLDAFDILHVGFETNTHVWDAYLEATVKGIESGQTHTQVEEAQTKVLMKELAAIAKSRRVQMAPLAQGQTMPGVVRAEKTSIKFAEGPFADDHHRPIGLSPNAEITPNMQFRQTNGGLTSPFVGTMNAMLLASEDMRNQLSGILKKTGSGDMYYEFPVYRNDGKKVKVSVNQIDGSDKSKVDGLKKEFGSDYNYNTFMGFSEFERAAFLALNEFKTSVAGGKKIGPGQQADIDSVFRLFGLEPSENFGSRSVARLSAAEMHVYAAQVLDALDAGKVCVLEIGDRFMALQGVTYDSFTGDVKFLVTNGDDWQGQPTELGIMEMHDILGRQSKKDGSFRIHTARP